jgi:hypothetical protein
MAKAAFNKNKTLCTRKLDLNFRKKLVTCYILSIALFGAETWTLWKVYQKYLESFEMWCGRKIEISWTDLVRNEEKLQTVKEESNIQQKIKRRTNWTGHIMRTNCLTKHIIEGKIKERFK